MMKHTILCTLVLLMSDLAWADSNPYSGGNLVTPEVHAPADVVVSCSYWFSLRSLDDPTDATFGRMVYGQSNIHKLKTIDKVCPSWCEYDSYTGYDPDIATDGDACYFYRANYSPAHPDNKYPLVWGWDGWVSNATSAVEIRVDDRRQCGIGLITRRFSVEDRGVVFYDEQKIWVIDCNPFYVSDDCTDQDDDVEWPLFCQQPDPLDGCFADLSPSNPLLGRPTIVPGADDQCNLISVDFKDDTITVEEGACLKVLRTWSVIDWCQYHPLRNPNKGRWDYLQVIKVRDKLDPEIVCEIGDCHPATKDSLGNCYGYIELRALGIDSCTVQDHLRYEYKIDLYDDGTGALGDFDLRVGPLSKLSESPSKQENEYAEFPDSVLNASGNYPLGIHRIKWFVEDGCGNVALCDTTFEVLDCKAPSPYCKTGIITVVMPSSLEIAVWAKDLDDGSFDNCSESLVFSFGSDTSQSSRIFTCDDIGIQEVEVWVTDEEGNQDFCITKVEIQDPSGLCPNSILRGKIIANQFGHTVSLDDVYARVYADGILVIEQKIENHTFELDIDGLANPIQMEVISNQTPLKGVTAGDLARIQKYLLGVDQISDLTFLLAADVNGNCDVSASDLSMIRKTLLGKSEDFMDKGVHSYLMWPSNVPLQDRSVHCHERGMITIHRDRLLSEYHFLPIKMGDLK